MWRTERNTLRGKKNNRSRPGPLALRSVRAEFVRHVGRFGPLFPVRFLCGGSRFSPVGRTNTAGTHGRTRFRNSLRLRRRRRRRSLCLRGPSAVVGRARAGRNRSGPVCVCRRWRGAANREAAAVCRRRTRPNRRAGRAAAIAVQTVSRSPGTAVVRPPPPSRWSRDRRRRRGKRAKKRIPPRAVFARSLHAAARARHNASRVRRGRARIDGRRRSTVPCGDRSFRTRKPRFLSCPSRQRDSVSPHKHVDGRRRRADDGVWPYGLFEISCLYGIPETVTRRGTGGSRGRGESFAPSNYNMYICRVRRTINSYSYVLYNILITRLAVSSLKILKILDRDLRRRRVVGYKL